MKRTSRQKRHIRVRKNVSGTENCPRLSVFRSSQHIAAQIINDETGKTLASVTDLQMEKMPKSEKAFEVGKKLAEKAAKLKIKKVVFDRGGFLYHGRVAVLAQGAREGGLEF